MPLVFGSVNQARGGLLPEGEDHPLHFPPPAEMNDIAELAAAPRAAPRLRNCMVAEMLNKLRRLGKRAAAGDVNIVTQKHPPAFLVRR